MKYYLIELSDYTIKVITENALSLIKKKIPDRKNFFKILKEISKEEYDKFLEEEYNEYIKNLIKEN